jgi:spermidine/putrescine transport system substrate-binding protein
MEALPTLWRTPAMPSFSSLNRLAVLLAVALASPSIGWAAGAGPQAPSDTHPIPTLQVLTWSEYMEPSIPAEFERRFHAKVQFTYFEADDDRNNLLASRGGQGHDVVLINELYIESYIEHNWLSEIDRAQVPNLRHLDSRWLHRRPGRELYGVPYFWGTEGIGYRKDLVPQGFSSWRDLLAPREALRGKILMDRSSRELMAFALKMLGYPASSTDRSQLAQAKRVLLAQKPYVRGYTYPLLSKDSPMVTGEIWASTMFNGDVLMLQEHDPNIVYAIPAEGGLLWIDYLGVLQASTQKRLAHAFINFINEPEIAARNARYLKYATPNKAAEKYLPREYFANPVTYPTAEGLSRCEFLERLPPRTLKYVNDVALELFDQSGGK